MLRQRIFWFGLTGLLIGTMLALRPASSTRGEYDRSLSVESHAAYRLRPDQGRPGVAIQVVVTRPNDSAAAADSIDVPVLPGATDIHAPTDDGQPLNVRLVQLPGRALARATVSFGHTLAPGERLSFMLLYELTKVTSEHVVVSPEYLYLPVVTIGDRAEVRVDLPQDFAWYGVVQPYGCEETADYPQVILICSGSSDMYVAAIVELMNESQYRTVLATSQAQGGVQPLDIRFLATETAWGLHVRDVAVAGIPVLESIVGVPLQTSDELVLLRVVREELGGYDGLFACEVQLCRIGVVPYASEHVVLHELAHLWTKGFESRWLAEGLAEFASTHATEQFRFPEDPPVDAPTPSRQVYLDDWGEPSFDGLMPPEEQLAIELAGYRESLRFFQDLEDTIGLENIQKANVAAAALDHVDSEQYLYLLEEASNVDLTDMFLGRVFPPSYESRLKRPPGATPVSALAQPTVGSSASGDQASADAGAGGHRAALIALAIIALGGMLLGGGAWWLASRQGGAAGPR